jgi:hypothetical protein
MQHLRSFQYGDPGNPDAFGDSTYDTGPNFDNGFDGTDDLGSPMFDEFESPTHPEVYFFTLICLLLQSLLYFGSVTCFNLHLFRKRKNLLTRLSLHKRI